MSDIIVRMEHVKLSFGTTHALKDVTFEIKKGEIFGFLGPSGAGKTTTIKLLTRQLRTESGVIQIFGQDIQSVQEHIFDHIGVLSDNSGFYEKLTVYENMKIFGDLKRIETKRIDEVLKKTKLWDARKKKAEKLSRGMKQRLLFARTILHKPELLFLDEPTSALDPATSEAVYEMIEELHKDGTTIFLTTHNMNEADRLCDRVAFLNEGNIVTCDNPDHLKLKYASNEVIIRSDTGQEYYTTRDRNAMIEQLEHIEGNIARITSVEPDLKTIFLDLTGRTLS